MIKDFFVVWSPHTTNITKMHESLEDAQVEAERLAKKYGGTEFIVLRPVAVCKITDVSWKYYHPLASE